MIGDNSDKIVVRPHQINDGRMVNDIIAVIGRDLFVVDPVFLAILAIWSGVPVKPRMCLSKDDR